MAKAHKRPLLMGKNQLCCNPANNQPPCPETGFANTQISLKASAGAFAASRTMP
jgi:hypothetical protein